MRRRKSAVAEHREAVRERIAEIPTLLRIPSACDRELLAVAAQKLVAEYQAGMVEFLNRR